LNCASRPESGTPNENKLTQKDIMQTTIRWIFAALALFAATHSALAADERPNIVLCMADDQGWGDMAYNGHPKLKTPVFDELASSALRLDHFYAAAPVCSPTRASVLTGRTPSRYGVFSWGHSLRPQEVTIAEALQSAGYATGHFGKWHVGSVLPDSPLSPGKNGFDTWISAANFFEIDPWLSRQGKAEKFKGEGSEIIVSEALKFIGEQHAAKKPFLAVVWFGSPHAPHIGTEKDLAQYVGEPERQRHFLAEITAMDRAMGKLREGLKAIGARENTLVWYCSDNGAIKEGSTGGLRGMKGSIYEGGLRVPCLIEWPAKITSPRRVNLPAGTVDIYPTVLELAGAMARHQPMLDGQSLVPLFNGEVTKRERPLGFYDPGIPGFGTPSDKIISGIAKSQKAGEAIADPQAIGKAPAPLVWFAQPGSYPGHAAWRDGDWKLHRIQDKQDGVRWELYHLASDVQEKTNVVDKEKYVPALQQALEKWLSTVAGSLRGEDYQ